MRWPPPARMTGCDTCDDHDVEAPDTLHSAALELHRAWHDCYRPLETAAIHLLDRITR